MKQLNYEYIRERMFPGFDGEFCKVNPKISYNGKDKYFLHYDLLYLKGTDVFTAQYCAKR